MPVTRLHTVFGVSALAVGCAWLPFKVSERAQNDLASLPKGSVDAGGSTPIQLAFEDIRFDGHSLSGRFLVGATGASVTLDKRLLENVSEVVRAVSDCASRQNVDFLEVDSFPPPPTQQDLLTLGDGYWYGAQVEFPLFDDRPDSKHVPDCIDVVISFHLPRSDAGVEGDARITVRARR